MRRVRVVQAIQTADIVASRAVGLATNIVPKCPLKPCERHYGGNHEAICTGIFAAQDAAGLTAPYRHFAEECLAEYDLEGWMVPDLVNPDDVP